MGDVNWWLMALAFLLGLVLTFVLTIRRVTREVPVYAALGRGPHTDTPEEPYGAGSVRVAATADGPSGFTVKGNEDSMLYHTAESPSYKQTIAEIWFRDVDSAERAGFTRWDKGQAKGDGAAQFAKLPAGPHGPGSAKPNADGSGPDGWNVKGNEDSMLYHSTESASYGVTRAEVWFRDVETAEKAGFSRWDSGKSQRGLR
jgi:hypothetical protein